MTRETKKAFGTRGSWFAEVDGEQLPVVHSYWAQRMPLYHDPEARSGELQFDEFVARIREKGRVILQRDKAPRKNAEGKTILERDGYIAVFQVELNYLDERGLTFRFSERLYEIR
jgi:hypothetical protein